MKMPRILVEGNIGSGKSTLVKMMARDLEGKAILEGVLEDGDDDGCPWLKKYYQTHKLDCPNTGTVCPVDWMAPGIAFKTQIWFISNRFNKYRQMQDPGMLYIGDRSLWGDMAFALTQRDMGKMEEQEFITYNNLWDTMMALLDPPDFMIYIKADSKFLSERIKKRGRGIEKSISIEYLDMLNKGYDHIISLDMVKDIYFIDAASIDGGCNGFDPNCQEYKKLLDSVRSEIEVFSK